MDISFSCVAFLNSYLSLLPANSTEAQRLATIVQGFHGLQVYANTFWYKHLLAYCGLLGQQQRQFSPELRAQLQLLLRFRKDANQAHVPKSKTRTEKDATEDLSIEALNHMPDVKRLVSDVFVFGDKINREGTLDKPLEGEFLYPTNLLVKA